MTCATGPMCQHQPDCTDHNCPGRPDRVLEFDPEATELWKKLCYWANVAAIGAISLIVICGVLWYWWVKK